MDLIIDGGVKILMELFSGRELTKGEWGSIRQSLRCLTKGERIFKRKIAGTDKFSYTVAPTNLPRKKLDEILRDLRASMDGTKTIQELLLEQAIINPEQAV